ncbi:hypothetical protein BDV41DRAFT_259288 [Aspergillus transmontanensis]|uniref:Uncharacterized protein n=1 Tax=Aspergillus transmontanensis TaxID=1034304 RepID=A0A5N6VYS1_9EURO|nr:hypothetical protein BDV41DRAFT_259288 [Aspergillus transmontanensis]
MLRIPARNSRPLVSSLLIPGILPDRMDYSAHRPSRKQMWLNPRHKQDRVCLGHRAWANPLVVPAFLAPKIPRPSMIPPSHLLRRDSTEPSSLKNRTRMEYWTSINTFVSSVALVNILPRNCDLGTTDEACGSPLTRLLDEKVSVCTLGVRFLDRLDLYEASCTGDGKIKCLEF